MKIKITHISHLALKASGLHHLEDSGKTKATNNHYKGGTRGWLCWQRERERAMCFDMGGDTQPPTNIELSRDCVRV